MGLLLSYITHVHYEIYSGFFNGIPFYPFHLLKLKFNNYLLNIFCLIFN